MICHNDTLPELTAQDRATLPESCADSVTVIIELTHGQPFRINGRAMPLARGAALLRRLSQGGAR